MQRIFAQQEHELLTSTQNSQYLWPQPSLWSLVRLSLINSTRLESCWDTPTTDTAGNQGLLRKCYFSKNEPLKFASSKIRVLFGCSVSFDFFQAQNSCWYNVITFPTCVSQMEAHYNYLHLAANLEY